MSRGAYIELRDLIRLRYQARGFSYLPHQPVHSALSGRKRSRLRGRGLDFDELRHYRPGDDIRNMDWRVTQRTGSPFVRIYTEERDRPVWLVIDQRLSMFFGSQYQMKSVAAAQLAALTAWRVIGVGDRIGAVLFNDHRQQFFKPARSSPSVMAWLEALVDMNNELAADAKWQPKQTALGEALKALAPRLGHDGLVIIVSDYEGWDQQCLQRIKDIRRSNDVIAALVSDPLEQAIDPAHKLVVSDGTFQLEVNSEDDTAITRYRNQFTQRLTDLTDTLKRHDIPLLTISTASEVATQVQRKLGGAAGVRGA